MSNIEKYMSQLKEIENKKEAIKFQVLKLENERWNIIKQAVESLGLKIGTKFEFLGLDDDSHFFGHIFQMVSFYEYRRVLESGRFDNRTKIWKFNELRLEQPIRIIEEFKIPTISCMRELLKK